MRPWIRISCLELQDGCILGLEKYGSLATPDETSAKKEDYDVLTAICKIKWLNSTRKPVLVRYDPILKKGYYEDS